MGGVPARRWRRGVAVLAAAIALLGATGCGPRRQISAWSPHWVPEGHAAFKANADLFASINGFWYTTAGPTSITTRGNWATRQSLTSAAGAANVPLFATINDGTGPGVMAAILADPVQRAAHVQTLLQLVLAGGYAGLDVDYEVFAYTDGKPSWPATRPNWVQFVAELGAALHWHSRQLAVTVPPVYDANESNTSGYWVYDYGGIAPHIDRLRIMAYELNVGQAGPGATTPWIERILRHATSVVPAGKIELGIATNGYDWVTAVSGTCPAPGAPSGRVARRATPALNLAIQYARPLWRDPASQEIVFDYWHTLSGPDAFGQPVSCQVNRQVWYPDATTVHHRTALARQWGLAGTVQWALGYEDPAQWPGLRQQALAP
jgi:spore germination protein YaaH